MFKRFVAVVAVFSLAACAPSSEDTQTTAQPVDTSPIAPVASVPTDGWHAMLVAGDNSSPAFDNGVETLRDRLAALGVQSIKTFSASRGPGEILATAANVRGGLASVGGAACFVYMTSHGNQHGFYLRPDDRLFTPATLEQALTQGCGSAPTVLVVSACHSGAFLTAAMRRPNRIILAAAAIDRTSFGCGADDDYTYYDQCFLQQLEAANTWRDVALGTKACVETLERRLGVRQESRPQMFFGAAVADLHLPGR